MVELYFGSTFLDGFEVLQCLERDHMKKKNVCQMSCGNLLYSVCSEGWSSLYDSHPHLKKKQLIAFM